VEVVELACMPFCNSQSFQKLTFDCSGDCGMPSLCYVSIASRAGNQVLQYQKTLDRDAVMRLSTRRRPIGRSSYHRGPFASIFHFH
jgi:hypothetical protein